jgi:hypothetical protein
MIAALRTALASDLDSALTVPTLGAWPAKVVPPCVFVVPPSSRPYVTGGQAYGEWQVAVDVVLLVDGPSKLTALEALVETCLANTADWACEGVDAPALVTVSGNEYLGTVISLSKLARL